MFIDQSSEKCEGPLISIVIPVFNREDTVAYCIESVLSQTYGNFELLIVDDASSDRSNDVISGFSDERIVVIRAHENIGAAGARNLGISKASADWIAFLDSDDRWINVKLERQVRALQDMACDPWVVIYTHFTIYHPESGSTRNHPAFDIEGIGGHAKLLEGWGPLLQGMLVSKTALNSVGCIDTNLCCWEDWDLSIRLSELCCYVYLKESLFLYYLHSGNRICRNRTVFYQGYYDVLKKHEAEIKSICGFKVWRHHILSQLNGIINEGLLDIADQYLRELPFSCFIDVMTIRLRLFYCRRKLELHKLFFGG